MRPVEQLFRVRRHQRVTLSRQLHDNPALVTVTHARAGENRPRWRTHRSHHQVAAVDVERRAGDVAGSLGGGEANQIGDFERSAEPRHGIARGKTFDEAGTVIDAHQHKGEFKEP